MPFRIILTKIVFLALGLRSIFAQVDVIGDQNFLFIQNNNEINLPFFSNQSLDTPNDSVQKAVIVIHGPKWHDVYLFSFFLFSKNYLKKKGRVSPFLK